MTDITSFACRTGASMALDALLIRLESEMASQVTQTEQIGLPLQAAPRLGVAQVTEVTIEKWGSNFIANDPPPTVDLHLLAQSFSADFRAPVAAALGLGGHIGGGLTTRSRARRGRLRRADYALITGVLHKTPGLSTSNRVVRSPRKVAEVSGLPEERP